VVQKLFGMVVDSNEINGTQFTTIPRLLKDPWEHNLIVRALCDDLAIRKWSAFVREVETIGQACFSGTMSQWAVAICSVHAQEYSFGPDADTEVPLTDLVKPFMHSLALQRVGNDVVHRWVGQEPTALDHDHSEFTFSDPEMGDIKMPYNTLTDLGSLVCTAIAMAGVPPQWHKPPAAGMNSGPWPAVDLEKDLFSALQQFAGGKENGHVFKPSTVRQAEQSSLEGQGWKEAQLSDLTKNAFLLKSHNMYPYPETDPQVVLEKLIQLGSIRLRPATAALMGATIANSGVCPLSGERCISQTEVTRILSQEYLCGMGEDRQWWGMHTGIPAVQSQEGMLMLTIPSVACVVVYCKTPVGAVTRTELHKSFTRAFTAKFPASMIGQLLPESNAERPISAAKREIREASLGRSSSVARWHESPTPPILHPAPPNFPIKMTDESSSGNLALPV